MHALYLPGRCAELKIATSKYACAFISILKGHGQSLDWSHNYSRATLLHSNQLEMALTIWESPLTNSKWLEPWASTRISRSRVTYAWNAFINSERVVVNAKIQQLKLWHLLLCLYMEAMLLQDFPPTCYMMSGATCAHKRDDLYSLVVKTGV